MLTATITLSSKRSAASFSALAINRACRNFKSEILISRGKSNSFDIKSMAQLQEFVLEKSPNIEIMVTGKDEMKAASVLVDYFNHGLGI
jgi:phosphotransferase system HPr-like phosphotransfer protein